MGATTDLHATLWKAADRLRGAMDAAQYKDVVLGLVFLRYMAGDTAWERLAAQAGVDPGGTGDRIREVVTAAARGGGAQEDEALRGVLPAALADGAIDSGRLAGLITLLDEAAVSGSPARDLLGEVYEYFLGQFARAEGRRAGEFYTPPTVVRLLVEMLQPDHGTVYDPCCGSGGMFVQASRLARAGITVAGQESNERTWRLARMNLAIHAMAGDLGDRPADTFGRDLHPDLKADFILANPPFNMSDWTRDADPRRWPYGTPPRGNANFAWLQLIAAKLAPGGTAGVVLANGSLSSTTSGEGAIRAAMIEDGLVACVAALPPHLFRSTQIPSCLWILTRARRRAEVLLIDARALGEMRTRTERVLSGSDIAAVVKAFHAWRQEPGDQQEGDAYADVPGFCYSATLDEVRERGHVLTPGLYVGAPAAPPDAEPLDERITRLTKELHESFAESARLEQRVREQLAALDDEWPA